MREQHLSRAEARELGIESGQVGIEAAAGCEPVPDGDRVALAAHAVGTQQSSGHESPGHVEMKSPNLRTREHPAFAALLPTLAMQAEEIQQVVTIINAVRTGYFDRGVAGNFMHGAAQVSEKLADAGEKSSCEKRCKAWHP